MTTWCNLKFQITTVELLMLGFFTSSFGCTIIGFTGSITLTAVSTVYILFLCLLTVLAGGIRNEVEIGLACYLFFVFWAWLSLLSGGVSTRGVQNIFTYSIPLLVFLVKFDYHRLFVQFNKTICLLVFTICIPYLLISLKHGLGHYQYYEPRPLALFALILLSWIMPAVRYESDKLTRIFYICTGTIVYITIISCLARTATAIATVIILFTLFFDYKSIRKNILFILLLFLSIYLASYLMRSNEIVMARFSGYDSVNIFGYDVNFASRTKLWSLTFESWTESIVSVFFGKGPGSSIDATASLRANTNPHNEYLRLLHDFGLIGFILWTLTFILMFLQSVKVYIVSIKERNDLRSRISLSSINVLISLFVGAFFLNPIIYIFIMLPLSIMILLGRSC